LCRPQFEQGIIWTFLKLATFPLGHAGRSNQTELRPHIFFKLFSFTKNTQPGQTDCSEAKIRIYRGIDYSIFNESLFPVYLNQRHSTNIQSSIDNIHSFEDKW
jgi:hypothetical protein